MDRAEKRGGRGRGAELTRSGSLHPVVVEILKRRLTPRSADDIRDFLFPRWEHLGDPFALPGAAEAVRLLQPVLLRRGHIGVLGDYDPDGIAGAALLVEGLARLGAAVTWHVPGRAHDGYGLTVSAIRRYLAELEAEGRAAPELLIVVDAGTNAPEEARWVIQQGMALIVVDHHLPLRAHETQAAGAVVVNPRLGSSQALSDLAAAGVALQLLRALVRSLAEAGALRGLPARAGADAGGAAGGEGAKSPDSCWREAERRWLLPLLDLAALATLSDHVPLTRVNRALVHLGLQVMNRRLRPGLAALMDAGARQPGSILMADDVVYHVVPRLNAICRLGDPRAAAELLLSRCGQTIAFLAAQAEYLNRERQEKLRAAMEEVGDLVRYECDPDSPVLVLRSQAFEPGLISLIANQTARRYGKPALILRETEPGVLAGSLRTGGRPAAGRLLAQCQSLLMDWGGHTGAGAVRVRADRLEALERALALAVQHSEVLPSPGPEPPVALPLAAVTPELAASLLLLEPTGVGNPRPVFRTEAEVVAISRFGDQQEHARIRLSDGGRVLTATAWWMGRQVSRLSRYLEGGRLRCAVEYTIDPDARGRIRSLTVRRLEPGMVELVHTRRRLPAGAPARS